MRLAAEARQVHLERDRRGERRAPPQEEGDARVQPLPHKGRQHRVEAPRQQQRRQHVGAHRPARGRVPLERRQHRAERVEGGRGVRPDRPQVVWRVDADRLAVPRGAVVVVVVVEQVLHDGEADVAGELEVAAVVVGVWDHVVPGGCRPALAERRRALERYPCRDLPKGEPICLFILFVGRLPGPGYLDAAVPGGIFLRARGGAG